MIQLRSTVWRAKTALGFSISLPHIDSLVRMAKPHATSPDRRYRAARLPAGQVLSESRHKPAKVQRNPLPTDWVAQQAVVARFDA